jgi:protein SCO1
MDVLTRASATVAAIAAIALVRPTASASEPKLIDQSGQYFTLAQLRGRPLVVTFVAAHCTDVCPLVNAQTAQAVALARQSGLNVRFVTITLDPEHDSPATMRELARRFDARTAQWIMASGRLDDVHTVMREFDVVAMQGQSGYADVHTTFVYLVGADGRVRRALLASNDLANQEISALRSDWTLLTS